MWGELVSLTALIFPQVGLKRNRWRYKGLSHMDHPIAIIDYVCASENHGYVETFYMFTLYVSIFYFTVSCYDNVALKVWLGLGAKNTFGSEKIMLWLVLLPQTQMENVPTSISVFHLENVLMSC